MTKLGNQLCSHKRNYLCYSTSILQHIILPNKCSVPGCNTNYQLCQTKPVFKFPQDQVLSKKWLESLNRKDYEPSKSSVMCIDHFEDKYLIKKIERIGLDYPISPIPTIHPKSIPLSQAPVPCEPRKLPKVRVYAPDELGSFMSINDVKSFDNPKEYQHFQLEISDSNITAFRVQICSGIARVKECIQVDDSFHVELSYDSCPIPLPSYIQEGEICKITSLDMLANLPTYCRNAAATCDTSIIDYLTYTKYYSQKGRPPYSSKALRFCFNLALYFPFCISIPARISPSA